MEEIEWKFEPGDRVVVLAENAYYGAEFIGATGVVTSEKNSRWVTWETYPTQRQVQLYNVRLDQLADDAYEWPFTEDELTKRIT